MCMIGMTAVGQDRVNDEIEAMKISFITKQVNLTPEQAQQFWPLYNQMQDELREIRKDRTGITDKPFDQQTNKEVESNIEAKLDKEQRLLDLKRKYINEFTEVISIKQVAKFLRAEEQFKRRLLSHISNRKNQDRRNRD